MSGFHCQGCGEWHDELPMSFGADAPYWYDVIAPEERERRAELSSDQCVIDGEQFFVRGVLKWLVVLGMAIAICGELSWLYLMVPAALPLVPLARFPGFAWMIATGLTIPRRP